MKRQIFKNISNYAGSASIRRFVVNNSGLSKLDEIKSIDELLKRDGTKEAFNKTINDFQEQRSTLVEKAEISEEEMNQYLDLEESLGTAREKIKNYEKEADLLNSMSHPIVILPEYTELLNDEAVPKKEFEKNFPTTYSNIQCEIKTLSQSILSQWNTSLSELREALREKINKLNEQISSLQSRYEHLKYKVEQNHQLQKISQQILEESQKRDEAKERGKKREELVKETNLLKKEIISSQEKFKEAYKSYCEIISSAEIKNTSLKFDAEVVWRKQDFSKILIDIFDNRGFASFRNQRKFDLTNLSENEYSYNFLNELWDSMDGQLGNGGLSIKTSYTKEFALLLREEPKVG